jgi:hypothetical protein
MNLRSSDSRIAAMTEAGLWGTQTLHDLLALNAASTPEREAVVDPGNKPALTGQAARRLSWGNWKRSVAPARASCGTGVCRPATGLSCSCPTPAS